MSRDAAPAEPITHAKGLSREAVVDAATQLVAEHGLAELSMRRLAERLGVWPTAVYHYVGTREHLADLVVDRVIAGVALPDHEEDPREWLRATAWALRAAGLRHAGVVDRILDRAPLGPAGLAFMDAAGRRLGQLGWAGADVAQAYNFFFTWLTGAVRKTERFYAQGPDAYAPSRRCWRPSTPRSCPRRAPSARACKGCRATRTRCSRGASTPPSARSTPGRRHLLSTDGRRVAGVDQRPHRRRRTAPSRASTAWRMFGRAGSIHTSASTSTTRSLRTASRRCHSGLARYRA